MLDFDSFQKAVATVHCAGGSQHAPILYGLVRWLRPKRVVEVGTFYGFSACWLARALQDNGEGELYCIDDWSLDDSRMHCGIHLAYCHVHERVTFVDGKSSEVPWPELVDMAYIDGDHSFGGVVGDVKRAIDAGARCIVLHDTVDWWGPREFMERGCASGWQFLDANHDGGLAILMRPEPKPPKTYTYENCPAGHI